MGMPGLLRFKLQCHFLTNDDVDCQINVPKGTRLDLCTRLHFPPTMPLAFEPLEEDDGWGQARQLWEGDRGLWLVPRARLQSRAAGNGKLAFRALNLPRGTWWRQLSRGFFLSGHSLGEVLSFLAGPPGSGQPWLPARRSHGLDKGSGESGTLSSASMAASALQLQPNTTLFLQMSATRNFSRDRNLLHLHCLICSWRAWFFYFI